MSSHHEVERTYTPVDPTEEVELPDLVGVGEVTARGRAATVELEAVYVDTVDLRLTRAGISLRRRTGGADEGWHLKVPAGSGRDELHRPLGRPSSPPPKPLRDAVLAWTAGQDLEPVATIHTRRTAHDLVAADGRVLAEVAEDETRSVRDGTVLEWREVEVELVDGDEELLDLVEERLRDAGLRPAAVGRKIERALADVLPEVERPRKVRRAKPASRVLHARLVDQLEELRRCESEVRRSVPDAVHRTRVAARRLRSALRSHGALLEGDVAERLQHDLQRLVRALGPERDTEVAGQRLAELLDTVEADLVVGPVRRRVRTELAARMREHRAATRAELASPAHLALLTDLDRLVADPPWAPAAGRRADAVLPRQLAKDAKRLAARLSAAEDEESLHRARSAAKRLRYAAETLEPAFGSDAARVARTAKELQQPLGVLQDTRLTRALLLEVAAAATAAGESSFTYGRLHAAEELAAAIAREEAEARWRRASKRRKGRALRLG